MCAKKIEYDEEELFAHTRMSLGDHIEELRSHLWSAIKGFLLAMILGFFVARPVLHFLIAPLHKVLSEMEVERLEKELEEEKEKGEQVVQIKSFRKIDLLPQIGMSIENVSPDERIILPEYTNRTALVEARLAEAKRTGIEHALRALSITEPFMIWFKVAMYTGFVLASPWVFYQIWSFIAAGLYPHEKKYIHVFLPLSITLFIAGVCLCQFLVLPMGIRWLLGFSEWVGVKPDLRLSEWLTFALLVPLVFGIAFQLPLVMFGMERVGFFTVESYRNKRRIAIFLIFLISGLANASPDPISMTMLAVPLCLLYELGIILCRTWPRPELDLDVEESEEMVEV
jgi:sec-independent protein translocase protein TatC